MAEEGRKTRLYIFRERDLIFRKGELGSGVSVQSLEDLVDLAADDLFNVLAGWCVVGSVGERGDDRVLDVADVAGGLEGGESRVLKSVKNVRRLLKVTLWLSRSGHFLRRRARALVAIPRARLTKVIFPRRPSVT